MSKTIVITGTSRGIGNYLAKYYLSLGNRVVGISRNFSDINNGDYVEFLACVSNEQVIPDIIAKFDSIDVLINNAGISSMNHTLLTPIETAVEIMDTNFMGTFLLSKECAKRMKSGGRIVNFSTIAYPLNLQGEAIYSASKAAIESLTRTMAYELGTFGITVNAVGPSPIHTDLTKGVPIDKMQQLLSRLAVKEFATYEDVSNVIDFFIKPESKFITGQTIYLGGVS